MMSSEVMNCVNFVAPQNMRLPSRRLADAELLSLPLMVLAAEVSARFGARCVKEAAYCPARLAAPSGLPCHCVRLPTDSGSA